MPFLTLPAGALPRLFIFVACAGWISAGAVAEDFKQPSALEPAVAERTDEVDTAVSGVRVPDGWKIELFAAEPDVANVVAFDVDHLGRVFVCESFRQNQGVTDNRGHDRRWLLADLAAQTVQDRIDYHKRLLGEAALTYAQHDDRVRRLQDTDGDGKADESVVVANGFNRLEEGTGAGILVRGSDIYYTNIPKLWKLVDEDDDGVAEQRVTLSDGYGVRVAFRGHDLHGLTRGPDGRLYFSIGDRGYHVTAADGRLLANPESGAVFRCEADGSGLEVVATGLRNPQELAFNDWGICSPSTTTATAGTRRGSYRFWKVATRAGECTISTFRIAVHSIANASGNRCMTISRPTSCRRLQTLRTGRVAWLTIPVPVLETLGRTRS